MKDLSHASICGVTMVYKCCKKENQDKRDGIVRVCTRIISISPFLILRLTPSSILRLSPFPKTSSDVETATQNLQRYLNPLQNNTIEIDVLRPQTQRYQLHNSPMQLTVEYTLHLLPPVPSHRNT